MRRKLKGEEFSEKERIRNRAISKRRCFVEQAFGGLFLVAVIRFFKKITQKEGWCVAADCAMLPLRSSPACKTRIIAGYCLAL